MRNLKALINCCFATFLCSNLSAQENDSILLLNSVQLNAYNYKEVSPAQILSGDQLQRLNSLNVADAVRFFSGVQIKDYGGIGGLKTINIRSMGSQHVGVFYDGIQLGNAQNGIIDLGRFSLDDMEEISLYNGQKSQIFQSAKDFGSSGSIYLNTKKPIFKDDKNTNLRLRYKLGSIQLINPSARLEQKINDHLALALSSEFTKSNGIYKFNFRRTDQNGNVLWSEKWKRRDAGIEAKRFEGTLFGNIKNGSWDIKSYNYISDREIPGALVKGHDEILTGPTLADRNHYLQGNFKKRWNNFETQFRGKFAYDYTHYVTRDSTRLKIDNTYIQREAYFSTSNVYAIKPNWDVSFAYDFQYNNLDANLVNFSYPERFTNLFAFASAYQTKKIKAQASLLGTFVTESVKMNTAATDKNIWTPAFFISYQPLESEKFFIRAFYKKIFRMPTFNDLYYTEIGYSGLRPEYTTQYNLGTEYSKKVKGFIQNISFKLDAYYNQVDDKIVAIPTGNPFRWMMTNLDQVRIKGLDFNTKIEYQIQQLNFSTLLAYTYQKAQDYSDKNTSFYKNQISYIPEHSGSVVTQINYKNWGLNYSFIYVGERYKTLKDNTKENKLNPWFTHDLAIQKDFKINQYHFRAVAEVNNLFNHQYEVIEWYPMPGTNLRFSLTFDL